MDRLLADIASALTVCVVLAAAAGLMISRVDNHSRFLQQIFFVGLLLRIVVGAGIFAIGLQGFFGGDAYTYDVIGYSLLRHWQGEPFFNNALESWFVGGGWGMLYLVAAVYRVVGRNMLAVQFVSAVAGAATAPIIFLCAERMFNHARVARVAALLTAFFPSLVLWSSQGLKDGFVVFLLAVIMLMTLRLGKALSLKHLIVLIGALFGLFSLRFYVFYIVLIAIAGSFVIGMGKLTAVTFLRNLAIIIGVGLAMIWLGVLGTAGAQFETYGSLEAVQVARLDQSSLAQSSFGTEVDVSTTAGAIGAIPLGMIYLLLAPFPWQLASLRQSITIPEMLLWWLSLPLLVSGLSFSVKHKLRPALPIMVFISMLTLAYSVFQSNVGTAYRQRSQLLIFYFIFIAVGYVLRREGGGTTARQGAEPSEQLPREESAM